MKPNLFDLIQSDTQARSAIGVDGSGKVRVYPWFRAEEEIKADSYVIYVNDETPQNNLSSPAKVDEVECDIVVYGKTVPSVELIVENIRRVIEPHCWINSMVSQYDFETRRYVKTIQTQWFVDR